MEDKKLMEYIKELCAHSGEDDAFAEDFFRQLKEDEEICQEFVSYMERGTFACKAKVEKYTVVDIMVWQMDHFKAWLDRDNSGTRQNKDRMLLLAFRTFLEMKRNPDKYIRKMQYETGTDYPDKY